jgi:hypothetical protein
MCEVVDLEALFNLGIFELNEISCLSNSSVIDQNINFPNLLLNLFGSSVDCLLGTDVNNEGMRSSTAGFNLFCGLVKTCMI